MRRPTKGDTVIIKGRGRASNWYGQIGIIVAVDKSNVPYKVKFKNPDLDDWFMEDEVELVEEDKFNVGDTVRIKSLKWYEENKNSAGHVHTSIWFSEAMRKFCGEEFKIIEKHFVPGTGNIYTLDAPGNWSFTDDMFEEPSSLINTKSLLIPKVKLINSEITLLKRNKLITNVTIV